MRSILNSASEIGAPRPDEISRLVLIGRFLISPLLCLAFTILMDVPETIAKVYVIQACLPCVLQIAVLAKFHHADVQFATTCVASTTIASAVTLPLWMLALTALF